MNEEQAIKAAERPQDIISPEVVNTVSSYLNAYITILEDEEWELQLAASSKKIALMKHQAFNRAEAEWKISKEFADWQTAIRKTRKFKRFKNDLRDRFSVLTNKRF